MRFLIFCMICLVAAMCLTACSADAYGGEKNLTPVQKECVPAGPCQKSEPVQKSVLKEPIQKCGPAGCELSPPVYKQTLISRIRRNREFRRLGRERIIGDCPCCR